MLTSQRVAIAAHLHVLLRRKTGRVTDTEWMAENLEYATEIIRYCRAKAREDGHAELAHWASRLEEALASATPAVRPLAHAALGALRARHAAGQEPDGTADPVAPSRYVGGIR